MSGFNLGFNQRNFNGTKATSTAAVNMGAMRGKASTSRMLNFCKTHSTNPSGCINQFVNITTPPPLPPLSYTATGTHTVSSNSQYNNIITFTGDGAFTISRSYPVSYIVVGGGGGGGGSVLAGSGGGGGGGVNTNSALFSGPYTITVGSGGTWATSLNPGNSSIIGSTSFVATGGQGGSTSGGASGTPLSTGGAGNGNPAGGIGTIGGAGGGGGISYSGGNGSINISTIYGNTFGAGGGGGSGGGPNGISGLGGNSSAGNGGSINGYGGSPNGAANTGGGGGGGGSTGGGSFDWSDGGNGGSGIVILYFNV
jgi:hypothetical protein